MNSRRSRSLLVTVRLSVGVSLVAGALACGGGEQRERKVAVGDGDPEGLVLPEIGGPWYAQLDSPGGPLGFQLNIGDGVATLVNGEESRPVSSMIVRGNAIAIRVDTYDSEIHATIDDDTMTGTWWKTVPDGKAELPFSATKQARPRLVCAGEAPDAPASVAGSWSVVFTEDDGSTYVGRAELDHTAGEPRLLGTILTDTGDYRYLEGCYADGQLGLSVFDGAHAFLFRAAIDGDALVGDFWSRDSYHATWRATPLAEDDPDPLADPYAAVGLASEDGRFRFDFPDVDGNMIADTDARFAGKVVIVDLFGTWCPNCNDQAPLLARWHREYGEQGLEVVGLAYEFTGDAERDAKYLRKYATEHRIEFPLLLAGTSKKADAAETVPDIEAIASYPTTLFIDRSGKVREIYSGFFGPATGERHTRMVAEHEALIAELLAESVTARPEP